MKRDPRARRSVAEPVDVDPGHALIVEMRQEFFLVRNGAFFEVNTIVFDQSDIGPAFSGFLKRVQHAGRLARNGITCLEHEPFCDKAELAAS